MAGKVKIDTMIHQKKVIKSEDQNIAQLSLTKQLKRQENKVCPFTEAKDLHDTNHCRTFNFFLNICCLFVLDALYSTLLLSPYEALVATKAELSPEPPLTVAEGRKVELESSSGGSLCPVEVEKTICFATCRYDLVRTVIHNLGFKEVGPKDGWNIYWSDAPLPDLQARRIQNSLLTRKNLLAANLQSVQRTFRKEYDFFPQTWFLPVHRNEVIKFSKDQKMNTDCTFICKPDTGCQGQGIFLPCLIDGPLRLYLHKEGLARFCTEKYKPPDKTNFGNAFMHLTNNAVNKCNISNNTPRIKRKMTEIMNSLKDEGQNVQKLMDSIESIIIKTVLAVSGALKFYYSQNFGEDYRMIGSRCFEILGFDILLDQNLKPYILEVNASPSFNPDEDEDDKSIKLNVIQDTLRKVYIGQPFKIIKSSNGKSPKPDFMSNSCVPEGLSRQFDHEDCNGGGFRLIYPKKPQEIEYEKISRHCQPCDNFSNRIVTDDDKAGSD